MIDNQEKFYILNGSLQPTNTFSNNLLTGKKVIYEVLRVIDSAPIFLDDHLMRLQQSIELSELKSIDFTELRNSIKTLLRNNPAKQKNIKINAVYRSLSNKPEISVFFIPSKYPTEDQKNIGVETKTIQAKRVNPEVKAENKPLRTYADEILLTSNCYEVLLVNNHGAITEGSRSNVFFILNEQLHTAPLNLVLGGITRKKIIDVCNSLNITVVQNCINISQINEIDGGFISGTSPGVLKINKIDNYAINIHSPLTAKVNEAYEGLVKNDIKNWKNQQ